MSASAALLQDHDQSWAADIRAAISSRFQNEAGVTRQRALPQYVANDIADQSQKPSPSSVPTTYAEHDGMPSPENGRNSRPLTNNREQTRDALTERFKVHVTDPAKVEARKVGRSAETVDGYRQIGVPMAWADMVEWCRTHPGFALDVVELMGPDLDRDREAYALFLMLQQRVRGG